MAKGDHKRVEDEIGRASGAGNRAYDVAAGQQQGAYDNINANPANPMGGNYTPSSRSLPFVNGASPTGYNPGMPGLSYPGGNPGFNERSNTPQIPISNGGMNRPVNSMGNTGVTGGMGGGLPFLDPSQMGGFGMGMPPGMGGSGYNTGMFGNQPSYAPYNPGTPPNMNMGNGLNLPDFMSGNPQITGNAGGYNTGVTGGQMPQTQFPGVPQGNQQGNQQTQPLNLGLVNEWVNSGRAGQKNLGGLASTVGGQVTGDDTIYIPGQGTFDLVSSDGKPIMLYEGPYGGPNINPVTGGVGGDAGTMRRDAMMASMGSGMMGNSMGMSSAMGSSGGMGMGMPQMPSTQMPNTAGFNPALNQFGNSQDFAGPSSSSLQGAMRGFNDFAATGGLSDQGIQDIRARSVAPTRAIYQNAKNEMERGRNLSNGYSPNFASGQARLARQGSQAIGDQSVNTEAMIADLIRSGKLAGNQGLSQIGTQAGQLGLQQQLGLIGAGNQRELGLGNLGLGYGNLGLGYGNLGLGYGNLGLGYGNLGLGQQRLGLDQMLGMGQLDLGFGRLGLDSGLGYGRLGLDTELGRGGLGVDQGRLGLDTGLGYGNLGLGYYNAGNNYDLGLGSLANQNIGQSGTNAANRGNFSLGLANARVNNSNVPGNFQSVVGNVGSAVNLGSNVILPWM